MPGARCTRSLVCAWGNKYAHEYSQRATGNHPAFPHAMVYGLYVLSPVIGFLVTVACQRFANLMPASRHQDHTTSPSAHAPVVCSAFRVHRIPPRVRDDRASAPLSGRDGEGYKVIWVFGKTEYFFKRGWTRVHAARPSGKSSLPTRPVPPRQ